MAAVRMAFMGFTTMKAKEAVKVRRRYAICALKSHPYSSIYSRITSVHYSLSRNLYALKEVTGALFHHLHHLSPTSPIQMPRLPATQSRPSLTSNPPTFQPPVALRPYVSPPTQTHLPSLSPRHPTTTISPPTTPTAITYPPRIRGRRCLLPLLKNSSKHDTFANDISTPTVPPTTSSWRRRAGTGGT